MKTRIQKAEDKLHVVEKEEKRDPRTRLTELKERKKTLPAGAG